MDPPDPPPPYEDINEAVREDWVAETTPAERVKSVMRHTYSPKRVDEIAKTAITTGKTARKHLETLARDGFLTRTTGSHGATRYHRSPASLITERATRLLADHTVAELTDAVLEMQDEITDYRRTYGAESPETLVADRSRGTLEGTTESAVDRSVLTEWQTTRRNLAVTQAALAIAHASDYLETEFRSETQPATQS